MVPLTVPLLSGAQSEIQAPVPEMEQWEAIYEIFLDAIRKYNQWIADADSQRTAWNILTWRGRGETGGCDKYGERLLPDPNRSEMQDWRFRAIEIEGQVRRASAVGTLSYDEELNNHRNLKLELVPIIQKLDEANLSYKLVAKCENLRKILEQEQDRRIAALEDKLAPRISVPDITVIERRHCCVLL